MTRRAPMEPGLRLVDTAIGVKLSIEMRNPAQALADLDELLDHAVAAEAQAHAMERQVQQMRRRRWGGR